MNFTRETGAAKGGISAFLCWGEEAALQALEGAVGRNRPLAAGDLCVGVLHGDDGVAVDEVMVSCPAVGMRILTAHGGVATAAAVADVMLQRFGAAEVEPIDAPAGLGGGGLEEECDRLLAHCVTATQAAIILRAREGLVEKMFGLAAAATPAQKIAILDELLQAWPRARAILSRKRLCLVGPRNSGKSTLFNLLLGETRALVSEHPGTTRDALAEMCDILGYAATLVDTAGLTDGGTAVDKAARAQALHQVQMADTVVLVLDASRPLDEQKEEIRPFMALYEKAVGKLPNASVVVINKIDTAGVWDIAEAEAFFPGQVIGAVSCRQENAAQTVKQRLAELWGGIWQGEIAPVTERQASLLCAMREYAARCDEESMGKAICLLRMGQGDTYPTYSLC